jgi:hypothetical protein
MSKPQSPNWDQIIQDYNNRQGTQEAFCQERGIKAAALSYKLKRRREPSKAQFLALAKEPICAAQEVAHKFPSGLCLSIRG